MRKSLPMIYQKLREDMPLESQQYMLKETVLLLVLAVIVQPAAGDMQKESIEATFTEDKLVLSLQRRVAILQSRLSSHLSIQIAMGLVLLLLLWRALSLHASLTKPHHSSPSPSPCSPNSSEI